MSQSQSNAVDFRAHVRTDSIAQKRSTPQKPKLSTTTTTTRGGGGRSGPRGSSSPSSPRVTPASAIKTTVVALVCFAILHFVTTTNDTDSETTTRSLLSVVANNNKDSQKGALERARLERKTRRQGAGEPWILPKRWRDQQGGDDNRDEEKNDGERESLPECRRVMLFKFSSTHGFSSEMVHYVRALVMGQKLGYTVLADDSGWNYGSVSDYFVPRVVHCRPPVDWFEYSNGAKVVAVGETKRWQSNDRVWLSRRHERHVDQWIRDDMLDPSQVDEWRDALRQSRQNVLPEGETLPAPFEEVYADFSAALKEVWKPNHQLAVSIRKQRIELGLGGGGAGLRHRKNSPNWGGRQRKSSQQTNEDKARRRQERQDEGDESEEDEFDYELDVAERSDRGPVIGVHLASPASLSASRADLERYGLVPPPSSSSSSWTAATLEGVSDAVKRLSSSSSSSSSSQEATTRQTTGVVRGYSTRGRPTTLFPPSSTTTLVCLGSSDSAFQQFSRDEKDSLPTSVARVVKKSFERPDDAKLVERWGRQVVSALTSSSKNAGGILDEWDQTTWNDLTTIPLALRVELTRQFVRDLTTLSRFADAFVVSGRSPTGQLSILLAGEEGAIGPRDFEGGSFGGRVRSVDGYWIPTSSIKSLYP